MTQKKHKCIVVDDEPLAIDLVLNHLKHFPIIEIAGTASNASGALELIHETKPTLLFLDIEMPEMNGLELAGILHEPPQIILTTAYRDYAVESYKFDVLDYLLKPISLGRFSQSIEKYFRRFDIINQKETPELKDHFFIQSDRKKIKITFADIHYIEGLYDYVRIFTTNDQHITKESIGNIYSTLPKEQFLRVHRSFIVPITKIRAYTSTNIELDGKTIPIGRAFKQHFLDQITK